MRNERQALQKELAQHLREADAVSLRVLRAQIQKARVERRYRLTAAREQCKSARLALVDRQRSERTGLRAQHVVERLEGKTACELGKDTAKREGLELEQGAKRTLKEERIYQRRIREAGKAPKVRATKREQSQEDDDAVRSNLPADLVPVFDAVRKQIKGTPRRTRTETFLEWAEENPDEILAVQEVQAEQYLKDLVKQQRELGRNVRKADRYKQPPETLRKLLAGVPF